MLHLVGQLLVHGTRNIKFLTIQIIVQIVCLRKTDSIIIWKSNSLPLSSLSLSLFSITPTVLFLKINQEINEILEGQNIIGFIKKQRLNWLGHVERMAEDNNVQKIKKWKPMSKRPIGRPKTRWEDEVLEDIKSLNVCNWKKVAQNRDSF